MSKRGDEPAFPFCPVEGCRPYSGMTLREWYIGQALANPAICWRNENNCPSGSIHPETLRKIAHDANVADAMGHADTLIAELEKAEIERLKAEAE